MDSKYYDTAWSKWKDMKHYGPASRHKRRIILNLLSQIDFNSVLDTSCGLGDLLLDISELYPKVKLSGSEFSKEAMEKAQALLPQATLYQLDLAGEPLNQKFDLVIANDVLEHIEDDNTAINNLYKMTNRYVLVNTIQGKFYDYEAETVGHVRSYTRKDIESKFIKTGLKIIKIIEWGWPFYSPIYRSLLAFTKSKYTTGQYSTSKKIIAEILYYTFYFNLYKKGDVIILLAEVI